MLNLGFVKPASTIYLPFDSFDGGTGAPITMTGFAVGDIHIYKNGGTTQRASTTGFTLLDTDGTDFDAITGLHGYSIDLSSNATADFYEAGADYMIRIGPVTIDGQTMNFWHARFTIGYEHALINSDLATLASQTSFTLRAGTASANNDAYNGCVALVHDQTTNNQIAIGYISDYVGATRTVTLAADPGIFTMAAGDNISIFHPSSLGPITHTGATIPTVTTLTGHTAQTGDSFARLGAPAGASIAADLVTIDNFVDDLETRIPDTISLANINAEVDTAIVDAGLDHLLSAAVVGTDVTDNSIIARLVSSSATADWDDFVNTTESLQALRDHIADGTNLTEAGGTGDHLSAIPWNANWDVEVESEVTDALVADGLDHLVSASVTGTDIADNSIVARMVSASATADWDDFAQTTDSLQAIRDHIGDGTNLTEAGGTGDQLSAIPTQDANVVQISGDSTAADRLEALMDGTVIAQVNDASATTTAFAADGFTEATDDHFNGRLITFISGALTGQQTDITDYDAAGHAQGSQAFVVTALTEAPANNDFFVIH